jgi:hypothetical protein
VLVPEIPAPTTMALRGGVPSMACSSISSRGKIVRKGGFGLDLGRISNFSIAKYSIRYLGRGRVHGFSGVRGRSEVNRLGGRGF